MYRIPLKALIAASVLLTACVRTGHNEEKGWRPTGDAEADTTVVNIDRGYGEMVPPSAIDSMTSVLEKRADATGNPVIRARALYNRARFVFQSTGNDSMRVALLDSALALTDSASAPYDMARYRVYRARGSENPLESYPVYTRSKEIFERNGDYASAGEVANTLATIYEKAGRDETALRLHRESARLMKRAGLDDWSFLMGYNVITSLYRLGRKEETAEACDSLLRLEPARRFSDIRPMIYMYLYDCDPRKEYVDSAFSGLVNSGRGRRWQLAVTEAYYTDYFLKHNQRDSATVHGERMRELMQPEYADARDGIIMRVNRDLYLSQGDSAAAAVAEADYRRCIGAMQRSREASQLTEAQWSERIDEMDRERHSGLQRNRMIQLILIMGAVILFGGGALFVAKRHRRMMKHIERSRRSLLVSELKAREKEEALKTVMDQMGGDDALIRQKLESQTRALLSTENEWEKFSVVFSEIHPGFEPKLKKMYPEMTNAEMRLACMIYIGLESKHIARLLAINPESVKKLRHRLRLRLALAPDIDLRGFLLSL